MSKNIVTIDKKIDKFKKITVDGDKSISIRWVLLSSLSDEVCQAKNLLMSEDVWHQLELLENWNQSNI